MGKYVFFLDYAMNGCTDEALRDLEGITTVRKAGVLPGHRGAAMIVTLPRRHGIDLTMAAPPSKSFTHRALIAAALARGTSTIVNPLMADDTNLTMAALAKLGVVIDTGERGVTIEGCDGAFSCPPGTVLDLDNSGTTLRLLASVALLTDHPVTLTGSGRMQERPVGPLADALVSLGGGIAFGQKTGFPPITVRGRLEGGNAMIRRVGEQPVRLLCPDGRPLCPDRGHAHDHRYPRLAVVPRHHGRRYDGLWRCYPARRVSPGSRSATGTGYSGRTYGIEGDYSSASGTSLRSRRSAAAG